MTPALRLSVRNRHRDLKKLLRLHNTHRTPCQAEQRHSNPVRDDANVAQLVDFSAINPDTQEERDRLEAQRVKVLNNNRRRYDSADSAKLAVEGTVDSRSHLDETHIPSEHVSPRSYANDQSLLPTLHSLEPLWEVSGKHAGEFGYGYKPDGTPVGSQYILYMRDRKTSNDADEEKASYPKSLGQNQTNVGGKVRQYRPPRLRRRREEEQQQRREIEQSNPEFDLSAP